MWNNAVCLLASSHSVSGNDYLGLGGGVEGWGGLLQLASFSCISVILCLFAEGRALKPGGSTSGEPKGPGWLVTPTEKYTSAKHEWKQRRWEEGVEEVEEEEGEKEEKEEEVWGCVMGGGHWSGEPSFSA